MPARTRNVRTWPLRFAAAVSLAIATTLLGGAIAAGGVWTIGARPQTSVTLFAALTPTGTSCSAPTRACTLTQAVAKAASTYTSSTDVTIDLASGTYPSSDLSVSSANLHSLTLVGDSATGAQTLLTGSTSTRVMHVAGVPTTTIETVTLKDGSSTTGGCVVIYGDVVVDHDTFENCSATGDGGAIAVLGGTVTADESNFDSNQATSGGGIAAIETGTYQVDIHLTGDNFDSNVATNGGGLAVFPSTHSVDVTDSTFASDSSIRGGGLWIGSSSTSVSRSTISSNQATEGGGVYVSHSSPSFVNTTFDANIGTLNGGGTWIGSTSTPTFQFVTWSTQTLATTGDSLYIDGSGRAKIHDSIEGRGCFLHTGGAVIDLGHNVYTWSGCAATTTSVLVSSSTLGLASSLAANTSIGPETLAITSTSPAYELVPTATCTPSIDERGLSRPGMGSQYCDVGAYELQAPTPTTPSTTPTTTSTPTPSTSVTQLGYDLVGADGGVFSFGTALSYGSLPGLGIDVADIVGVAVDHQTGGYWLVGRDGGVFAFDAPFYGSLPERGISVHDIVGIAAAAGGAGYDLVGADGGVFSFGTAVSYGSLPGLGIDVADIVGIAIDPTGGYWLAGADGGVFAFGPTPEFYGSMGGQRLNAPVVGIAAEPWGGGYWLAAADGGVFAFGPTAEFYGSMGATHLNAPIVGIASDVTGGYWLAGADGGVFSFDYGRTHYYGSMGGTRLNAPIVSISSTDRQPLLCFARPAGRSHHLVC